MDNQAFEIFEKKRKALVARIHVELRALCKEFGVCIRCRDANQPLESKTMCHACVQDVRAANRAAYHKRKAAGKPCRGQDYHAK